MIPTKSRVTAWPAPTGIQPSKDYELTVNGEPIFVWSARVREQMHRPPDAIQTHLPGCPAETAAFAQFDFEGAMEVVVTPLRAFRTAALHPLSAGVQPVVKDGTVRFTMDRPRFLTVMLDGSDERPLHLFASAPETDVPNPGSPDVLYYGPGIHEIEKLDVKSGQTLYLAGGAVLRAKMPANVKWTKCSVTGHMNSNAGPIVHVHDAQNVRIRGRGILDGSLVPHAARPMIVVEKSQDVSLEGITIQNAPGWTITLRDSDRVRVEGIKEISGRLNSDGINPVNARDVTIRNCFIRNHDDSIIVKTLSPQGDSARILVEGCVLWNDWNYAIGINCENRAPIRDLVFRNCDILFARHYALGVTIVDSGTVQNVLFEDMRVEDLSLPAWRFGENPDFIRMSILDEMWAVDKERGHIRDVTFRNVRLDGKLPAASVILGFDAEHGIDRVTLENIRYLGKRVASPADMNLKSNMFAREINVR